MTYMTTSFHRLTRVCALSPHGFFYIPRELTVHFTYKGGLIVGSVDRIRQAFWDRNNMKTASTRISRVDYSNLRVYCFQEETTIHRLLRSFIAYILIRYFGRENVSEGLRNADAHFIETVQRFEGKS